MIGIDVVEVDRFRAVIERAPGIVHRFFTEEEIAYCRRFPDPLLRLAGTFAAKEAVMKTLSLTPAPAWARRVEISRKEAGAPLARVEDKEVEISISHDGGIAVAVATLS